MSHHRPSRTLLPELPILLEGFDRLPLVVVLAAYRSYPLKRCPMRGCGGGAEIIGEDIWRCRRCCVSGGSAAWVAAFLWNWTGAQLAEVVDGD